MGQTAVEVILGAVVTILITILIESLRKPKLELRLAEKPPPKVLKIFPDLLLFIGIA